MDLSDNRNMRRRSLLRTLFGGSVLLGGCSVITVSDARLDSGLMTEFTILSQRPRKPIDDTPLIRTNKDADRVTITGKMWQGSPCETVKLTKTSYDDATGELSVVISSVKKKLPIWMTSCQASLGAVKYQLKISFATSLPTTATVTERPPDGFDTQTATKPLDW